MTPPATTPTDLVMNAPIVETDKTHLNAQENQLLKELLRPGASIEAVIPPDASPEDLWRTLDACVRGLRLLEARTLRLKPIIGKILLIFEQKPSLYKDLGFETYSDFMRKGVYDTLGLHHTSAYEGKLVARDWPQIDPDRYVKIGPKKLNILSKFATGRSPNAEALLQTVEKMKVPEARQYFEQRGFIERGETEGAVITITTNQAVYRHYKRFFGDSRVHEAVGSKDADKILEALIQEGEGSWLEIVERNNRAMVKEVGR